MRLGVYVEYQISENSSVSWEWSLTEWLFRVMVVDKPGDHTDLWNNENNLYLSLVFLLYHEDTQKF